MQFIDPALDAYCEVNSGFEPSYLKELETETKEKVNNPQMLSGHLQGRFLSMLSHLVQPKIAVEIGTFTGYSALCLAEGLAPDGKLHTIDVDKELTQMRERYIRKVDMGDRIVLHNGPALQLLKTLPTPFDLVFIDADKSNYPNYFDRVVDKVRPGGLIIADNLLWGGKVLLPGNEQDADTRALVEYARRLHADPRVQPVLVPLRDGLLVARKR